MRRTLLALLIICTVGDANAKDIPVPFERPAEALATDREAADDDAQDRARRRINLREQADAHRARLRDRLRALYKMSNGGSVRLLLSANNLAELSSRSVFVRRLLERDLDELKVLMSLPANDFSPTMWWSESGGWFFLNDFDTGCGIFGNAVFCKRAWDF